MNILLQKLTAYKKKYYRNLLIRGLLLGGSLILTTYLIVNTAEFFGRFNPIMRAGLLFTFLGITGYVLYQYIIDPVLKLNNISKPISNEEAARQIGKYFTNIDDKLLNTIQLQSLSTSQNQLLLASIDQRTQQLSLIPFTDAVDISQNRRYLRYIVPPALIILLILARFPKFFTDSSQRIVNFRKVYLPEAPFSFELKNKNLDVFKNEDLTVTLHLEGNSLPETVYLYTNGRKQKMTAIDARNFSFTFNKIQKAFDFHFEAADFQSNGYEVHLIPRPSLEIFSAKLKYPTYLKRTDEILNNVGNLLVPEGTQIQWEFKSADTDSLLVTFGNASNPTVAEQPSEETFLFSTKATKSENYQVKLKNRFGFNKEDINYFLDVIPDQYPKITLESFKDTTLFNYLVFGGNIADDYGFSKLAIVYSVIPADEENKSQHTGTIPLNLQANQTIQNYYHQWSLEKLQLAPGDKIQYYVQVWDNDGVNGPKAAKSQVFTFAIPNDKQLEDNQEQLSKQTSSKISSALTKASRLKKEINTLEDRLKTKKQLDFQDKKQIEEVLKKRQELNAELEKLQEQMKSLNQQQNRFSETNPQLMEKMDQLQKLMNNLLDEETKKLYEELEKLLETNKNNFNLLDKLSQKENTLEKEIERALEMFKQLQFEQKIDKQINDLKELAKEQQKLAEKTEDTKNNNTNDSQQKEQKELEKKQQDLNEKFEEQKQNLEELKEMDKELEQPTGLEQMDQDGQKEKDISEKQKQSLDQLQNNQNKKASQNQKDAAQKMEQMAKEMEQMQGGMEMEQNQENLDDLRDILENLITLSFDQEKLMKDFRNVNLSDPRFPKLAQEQLKLKDDAKIIEDSLYSLAKRVFQLESFVTREVTEMKQHMDESTRGIKERRLSLATGQQQLAMTSMNNLALMLNDALKQMQEQMKNAKAGKGKPKPNKKPQPGMSELQQQLNKQIQDLKQGGKSGRQLSEELAKMAAQQEMIRKALQQMEKSRNEKGEKPGGMEDLLKKMEETEKDLVNKNLSQDMLKRNQDIVTRLLEAEKSQRERDEDEQRKAEQAKDVKPSVPPAFEQYIKNKEKQIELLKTIPPALSPYYRKEVDEYFKKLGDSTK
ncbi:ATPase [Cytophagaceae bacterium YF14B1]|uniref:ATPase n=1 Tax=Xanthocytophaga flava TaxID=3048013 RepID=A0AAE3QRZ9_9BACT|nr:DUF4175 family protein [Xanthocytophaga flavus]MDJ1482435.1 ATPase [Xanthocytophaga flavus]